MTIYEIARLAGVSATTVSRVINNNRGVSKKRKERVVEVVKRFNYEPDLLAQCLGRKNRSH